MHVLSFETLERRLLPSTLHVTGVANHRQFRLVIQTTPPAVDILVQGKVTDQASIDHKVKAAYETMMGSPYPRFVHDLKYDLNLEENGDTFQRHHSDAFVMQFRDDAILGAKEDGNPFDEAAPSVLRNLGVKDLLPTQNEIDVDKTLKILKDPAAITLYRNGGVATDDTILTAVYGNQRYIIDGHHRWSNVFICNPNGQIQSNDVEFPVEPAPVTPIVGLEATQLTIAGDTGKVPRADVSGLNLLTIGKEPFAARVKAAWDNLAAKTQKADLEAFAVKDLKQLTEALWNNVREMQADNQPITGTEAPRRKDMPQTDTDGKLLATLASGEVNYLPPYFAA
jgi:hypothetical protein